MTSLYKYEAHLDNYFIYALYLIYAVRSLRSQTGEHCAHHIVNCTKMQIFSHFPASLFLFLTIAVTVLVWPKTKINSDSFYTGIDKVVAFFFILAEERENLVACPAKLIKTNPFNGQKFAFAAADSAIISKIKAVAAEG